MGASRGNMLEAKRGDLWLGMKARCGKPRRGICSRREYDRRGLQARLVLEAM
jgi:hypothetical protein